MKIEEASSNPAAARFQAASQPDVAPFFNPLPVGARFKFLFAVFLVFAPLMILTNSALAVRSMRTMVAWCVASGTIAVLWASSYIVSRKLIGAAIAFTVIAVMCFATRWPAFLAPEAQRPNVMAVIAALLIAAGYVFFVLFVSGEGARTLRLHTELRLARQIHKSLVPPISISTGRFEIFGRSDASSEMGGDLIDLIVRDTSGQTDLYLADVSGHGVRAGVLMAMVKSALRARLLTPGAELGEVIADLNRVVGAVKEQDMFVTLACARFASSASAPESSAVRVSCALAGHLPILHWKARTRTLESIENQSLPLGVADEETFAPTRIDCDPRDLLVLYTDGLTECINAAGEEFGMTRLNGLIQAHADRPVGELFVIMMDAVHAHGPQRDDQTLVIVRFVAPQQ
ncbi:MAG: PP2C family protein-serine/threonine phosphatase [Tepidisphaeraceae bacterium]